MYSLNLTLNAVPKSLNKALRTNRWVSNKLNKEWDSKIFWACCDKLPPKPLQKARIRIERHYYRTLDYDGLVGSLKPVVDGLVSAGVLASDSWNVLHKWDCDQVFRAKKDGGLIRIELTEVV